LFKAREQNVLNDFWRQQLMLTASRVACQLRVCAWPFSADVKMKLPSFLYNGQTSLNFKEGNVAKLDFASTHSWIAQFLY